jgi:hypothetical protein
MRQTYGNTVASPWRRPGPRPPRRRLAGSTASARPHSSSPAWTWTARGSSAPGSPCPAPTCASARSPICRRERHLRRGQVHGRRRVRARAGPSAVFGEVRRVLSRAAASCCRRRTPARFRRWTPRTRVIAFLPCTGASSDAACATRPTTAGRTPCGTGTPLATESSGCRPAWRVDRVRYRGLLVWPLANLLVWPFHRSGRTDHALARSLRRGLDWNARRDYGPTRGYEILLTLSR